MTWQIAFVFATRQRKSTWQWTEVIDIDAAFLLAFVFATGTFFGTEFLAASIIGPGRKLATFDHLIHVATATFDSSLFVTGWTIAGMALECAVMGIGGLATFQGLTTHTLAKRYGI